MNKNFIAIKNNFLTKKECKSLIKDLDKGLKKSPKNYQGYEYKYIKIKKIQELIVIKSLDILKTYALIYPELDLTEDKFELTELRFKKFKGKIYFDKWHSENCLKYPNRILNLMIYLSDHDCGTEFFSGEVIPSVAGSAVVFPSYFTHTHKGQPCPKGKTRYIITGYFNFILLENQS